MSTDNRTLRRKLDREVTALEDCYLALQDLKSDGALAGRPIQTILLYDNAVESIAAAMHHIRAAIPQLDVQSGLWTEGLSNAGLTGCGDAATKKGLLLWVLFIFESSHGSKPSLLTAREPCRQAAG